MNEEHFAHSALALRMRPVFFLVFTMVLVSATALALQYIGGYMPCTLCHAQRIPYYVAVPLLLLGLFLSFRLDSPCFLRWASGLSAVLMLVSFCLAMRHIAVERGWQAEPLSCNVFSSALPVADTASFLEVLEKSEPIVSCSQLRPKILGFSLSHWNALASFFLMSLAFYVTLMGRNPSLKGKSA